MSNTEIEVEHDGQETGSRFPNGLTGTTSAVAGANRERLEFKLEGEGSNVEKESIYQGLASHQRSEPWFGRDLVEQLQVWAVRINVEFNLDLHEIVLRIDELPCTRYGHFRIGHNGFGLKGEIALNSRYLSNRPFWQVLGTLLHELLHAWQHAYGHPSRRDHHNHEFRQRARDCGLNIDERGVTGFAAASLFKDLLRRYGVIVPEGEFIPNGDRPKGKSKLKKWSCGCTNIRCAVPDLCAQCLKCGRMFENVD